MRPLDIPAIEQHARELRAAEIQRIQDWVAANGPAGNLAAATSTGGMNAKPPGRVGDSPIIGAGTYADNASCAVSATGDGEYFIRASVARMICARVQMQGMNADEAAKATLDEVKAKERFGLEELGEAGRTADRFGASLRCQRCLIQRHLQQELVKRLVILDVTLSLANLDLVQRRLGNVDMTAFDQLWHLAVEQRQ